MSGAEIIPIVILTNALVGTGLTTFTIFQKPTKSTEEVWDGARKQLKEGINLLQDDYKDIDQTILQDLYQRWKKHDRIVRKGLSLGRASKEEKNSFTRFKKRVALRRAAMVVYSDCKIWREEAEEASIKARNKGTILQRIGTQDSSRESSMLDTVEFKEWLQTEKTGA